MTHYQDDDRHHRHARDWRYDREPQDRMQGRSSRFDEPRHWSDEDRRGPYDQPRGEAHGGPARSGWEQSRSRGGGYAGAQFGDWESGAQGGAVGSQLYGGYDRHGAGRNMSQSDYGGYGQGGGMSGQGYGGNYGDNQERWHGGHQGYRGQSGYETGGYAPGSQIWDEPARGYARGRGGHDHDHEPDYLHWREQQMRGFDEDYAAWRNERRQKFSSDFDTWRRNRPRDENRAQAENPIVGDVSDGGTGDMSKKK